MTEKKKTNCAHGSFKCEEEMVDGFPATVFVLRCKDCGEAINAFLMDDSVNLSKIFEKQDVIHRDIKELLRQG